MGNYNKNDITVLVTSRETSNVFVFYLLYKKKMLYSWMCCKVYIYVFIIIKNNKLHEYIMLYTILN